MNIYESGELPDFLKTLMIPLAKKIGTKKCGEHRIISLVEHAAKILLRVLNRRLERIMEENMAEEQFGFRRRMGTRDAIGCVRTIGYNKLIDILKEKGVNWNDRRLISKLYLGQQVALRVGGNLTEWFDLGQGVRQGYPLSPTLFNIYAEYMVSECWKVNKGVNIGEGENKESCSRTVC